jgi:hypothetical protein
MCIEQKIGLLAPPSALESARRPQLQPRTPVSIARSRPSGRPRAARGALAVPPTPNNKSLSPSLRRARGRRTVAALWSLMMELSGMGAGAADALASAASASEARSIISASVATEQAWSKLRVGAARCSGRASYACESGSAPLAIITPRRGGGVTLTPRRSYRPPSQMAKPSGASIPLR